RSVQSCAATVSPPRPEEPLTQRPEASAAEGALAGGELMWRDDAKHRRATRNETDADLQGVCGLSPRTFRREAAVPLVIYLPARGRRWIERSKPTGRRFAIIDDPPTLTNGSGMPVIGAIPIVIPTLTKTWKSSATTRPPATIAANGSRASVTIRRPRQTTSR